MKPEFVSGDLYTRNGKDIGLVTAIVLTPEYSLWYYSQGEGLLVGLIGTAASALLRDNFVWRLV